MQTDTPLESIFSLTNHEIFVLTSTHQGQRSGQVATWVMLATLIPERMRVMAAISSQNFTQSLIHGSGRFVVNLLSAHQQTWVPHFGLRSGREFDKLTGIEVGYTDSGIPLLPDTCGWAECEVGDYLDLGDRIVYLADVVQHHFNTGVPPLRKLEAIASLGPEVLAALSAKRQEDAERDRGLIRPLRLRQPV